MHGGSSIHTSNKYNCDDVSVQYKTYYKVYKYYKVLIRIFFPRISLYAIPEKFEIGVSHLRLI